MERVQLWSCGGGRQSAGIAALILQGRLPKPEAASMVRLPGEHNSVWPYVDEFIRPAMESLGVPFTAIDPAEWGGTPMYGGEDGETVLLPAFTSRSGSKGKFPEFCSGKWKRDVFTRWAASRPGWKDRGVDVWIGISWDERKRRRANSKQWIQTVYPLLDMCGKMIDVSACLRAVEEVGWPAPPRSRCSWCPNQTDREWAELSPEEWEAACLLDESLRTVDLHVWLHKSLIPLRLVVLAPGDSDDGLFGGGCSTGTCY